MRKYMIELEFLNGLHEWVHDYLSNNHDYFTLEEATDIYNQLKQRENHRNIKILTNKFEIVKQ